MSLEFHQPWYLMLALPVACALWWWHLHSLSDFSGRQRFVSLLLRAVICLAVLCSLAGLTWLQGSGEPFVVFLVDRSASVGSAGERVAREYLQSAERVRGDSGVAWIPFAASPGMPAADPGAVFSPLAESAAGGTNLSLAVQTAAAAVPAGYVPRLVLLSDGNETEGDVLSAAAAAGVPVWTVPLPGRDDPEVQISEVLVPPEVREGEPFVVEVVVSANHADEGLVEVFRGGYRVLSERRQLVAGENRLRFEQTVERDRLAVFRARISGLTQDTLLDNNAAVGLVSASGRPRVLIVESEPERIEELAFALEEEGVAVDVRPVEGIPESLEALQNYELLVVSNVPATRVSPQQMEVIRTWVQEFGGGFLMLGGEQSFGLGGYYRSAIEEVLPVRCDFEKEQEKPSLAMVLVLDRSGSMDGEKLEMARTAARSAVELLGERDQTAVLAFDDQTWVISEMQPAGNRGQISDQISRLQPGGGTSMYPAMELAAEMLNATSARLKHVILLTDGISNSGDFEGLAQRMASSKVTVSVVALGPEDATDSRLLKSIARIGRGRFYAAPDAAQVPRIFAKETMTAGKSALEEEPFLPQVVRATRALADLDLESAPLLLGYVVTKPKAGSEVILATEKGDPLLVWWRTGLGMSAAFTSDAKSRWAAEWLTWPGYGKFWTQVMRQLMRRTPPGGLQLSVTRRGSRSLLTVDAADAGGSFLNSGEAKVLVTDPAMKTSRLTLQQIAPGRYAGEVSTAAAGAWNLDFTIRRDGQTAAQQSRAIVTGEAQELRLKPVNTGLLEQLSATTGGLSSAPAEQVFQPALQEAVRPRSLRPWLLGLAALLLIPDTALRRLELRRLGERPRRGDR
ncbi:MAG: hypothetical protein RLZZ436_1443 [Planctomycetota bacterium]